MSDHRAGEVLVRIHGNDEQVGLFYDVEVPVYRDGRTLTAEIPVRYDMLRDVLSVEVSGELLDQSPEAVTAAVQLAFRAVAESRRG
jgi:hypothetical protein